MSFSKISTDLYVGFWIGFVITAIVFTFILVYNFTSNDFLKQNNIYIDGKYYQLCPKKGKCK